MKWICYTYMYAWVCGELYESNNKWIDWSASSNIALQCCRTNASWYAVEMKHIRRPSGNGVGVWMLQGDTLTTAFEQNRTFLGFDLLSDNPRWEQMAIDLGVSLFAQQL